MRCVSYGVYMKNKIENIFNRKNIISLLILCCVIWAFMVPVLFAAPNIFSPMSFPLVVCALYIPVHPYITIILIPIIGFWLSMVPILRGNLNFSYIQFFVILFIGGLNIVWIFYGFDWGLKYQGLYHVVIVSIFNCSIFISLLSCYFVFRKNPSFGRKTFLNGMIWIWLAWYAFPYLGETI